MQRYTQREWQEMIDDGRAVADEPGTGDDPQPWTVNGIHGQALNPDNDSDDVVFVAD